MRAPGATALPRESWGSAGTPAGPPSFPELTKGRLRAQGFHQAWSLALDRPPCLWGARITSQPPASSLPMGEAAGGWRGGGSGWGGGRELLGRCEHSRNDPNGQIKRRVPLRGTWMWQEICFRSKGLRSFLSAAPQQHPKGQVQTQLVGATSRVAVAVRAAQSVKETGVRPG